MSEAQPSECPLLIFDGACGTTLQTMHLPASVWQGWDGCNEILNVTAPAAITELHRMFFEAGAQVVETNTFGASRTVLAEYGLDARVRVINEAAVANARKAAEGLPGRFVAGSVGPTTKLPSLGHISRDALFASMVEQVEILLGAGVDLLVFETCQDLLQLKTCLVAVYEAFERAPRQVPVLASVTLERTGTMLVGSDIAAVAATLEPFPLFSLGLNCATGPADMESHIRYLSQQWPGRLSCMPNQGLPEVVEGQTYYPLSPADFARHLRRFVVDYGVSVVGGCCGTSPEHIRALAAELRGVTPAERRVEA
jgi:5-methyltetrahydrofolate--homocysteine methyltransferase